MVRGEGSHKIYVHTDRKIVKCTGVWISYSLVSAGRMGGVSSVVPTVPVRVSVCYRDLHERADGQPAPPSVGQDPVLHHDPPWVPTLTEGCSSR